MGAHCRAISPTTCEGYEAFAKKKRFKPEIVELDDGASGCFLGPKGAKKTLVWFHGMCPSAFSPRSRRYQDGVAARNKARTDVCLCRSRRWLQYRGRRTTLGDVVGFHRVGEEEWSGIEGFGSRIR